MNAPFDLDKIGGPRALNRLIDEVLLAGEDALQIYRQTARQKLCFKADKSPVTEADHIVEARLCGFIATHYPEAGFLGEESGLRGKAGGVCFLVDPVDGTRAFVRNLPTWSILVGMECEGEPVLGIAYQPAQEQLFVAVRGHGAYGNGKPLRVSLTAALDEATIAHGALGQFEEGGCIDALGTLARTTHAQRGLHDFEGYRALLRGSVDAMVDPQTRPWDLCAPAVLVREAGGRLTSFEGLQTVHGGSGLASNGQFHDVLLQALAQDSKGA
ncbi:MAG: hypothetical protein H6714_11370 [Myxococcales bacterium]|nr:hypothetical protein [Myxococcales bacterium]